MADSQQGRARDEYFRLRDRYRPAHRKIVFVLESPPKSGRYFYDPEGSTQEPLFSAMMKDVLEIRPKTKDEGLKEFASRGLLLVDATYTPVNHPHLSPKERNQMILDDLPLLLEDLRKHTDPSTRVVLVKVNVCELLETKLLDHGFNVLNHGIRIPFPSTGQQNRFREMIRTLLGL